MPGPQLASPTAGTVTAPPAPGGWQISYEIGIQDNRPVVNAVTIRSLVGIPRGGLTTHTARGLIRTGEALREFTQGVADRRILPEATEAEIADLMAGRENWRHQPTPAFRRYLQYLESLPAIEAFVRGRRLSRRERIAEEAGLYVQLLAEGHPYPRPRVAQLVRRTVEQVRDDLHAARTEQPVLLTEADRRGFAGGKLTPAAKRILKAIAAAEPTTRRAARPTRKGRSR